jgi:hypothetical protein
MHSTLCLMQALNGRCLPHLTFRSAQRIQEYDDLLEVIEEAGAIVSIVSEYSSEPWNVDGLAQEIVKHDHHAFIIKANVTYTIQVK